MSTSFIPSNSENEIGKTKIINILLICINVVKRIYIDFLNIKYKDFSKVPEKLRYLRVYVGEEF